MLYHVTLLLSKSDYSEQMSIFVTLNSIQGPSLRGLGAGSSPAWRISHQHWQL